MRDTCALMRKRSSREHCRARPRAACPRRAIFAAHPCVPLADSAPFVLFASHADAKRSRYDVAEEKKCVRRSLLDDMAGVVVPIPTKVNGNCMIDAVLASKQEWEDVLWIGSVAYTRGQDVEVCHHLLAYAARVRTCSTMCISCVLHHMQVRGALLDFIEKNAQTDFSRCVPMVARACGLRRLTFDDIIRRWKTEHSTSEYVKQARAVLPHGRYAALDTVMLVAMAIVDGCTYVVHLSLIHI